MRLLGALFSSTLFEGRAPKDHALITAFMGGAMDDTFADLSTDAIIGQTLMDLEQTLGIDGEPHFQHLTRYKAAIPQYQLGHGERIEALELALASVGPGLHLRANWKDGISVADCVRSGELCAEKLSTGGL